MGSTYTTNTWSVSGNGIYRDSNIGIGGTSVSYRLHLQGTGALATTAPILMIQNNDADASSKMGGIQTRFMAATGKYLWNITTGGNLDPSFGNAAGVVTHTMMTCTTSSYNAYTTPIANAGWKWQAYDNSAYRNALKLQYSSVTIAGRTSYFTAHVDRIGVGDTAFNNTTDAKIWAGEVGISGGENQILACRNMYNETATQHHGFADLSTNASVVSDGMGGWTPVYRSVTGGINSYDAQVTIAGGTQDHYAAFQHRPQITGGTNPLIYGFIGIPHINGGTTTTNYGTFISNPTGSGTITNNIAHYVAELTRGSNNAAYVSRGDTGSLFGASSATDIPQSSSLLELKSTNKGFTLPRMTRAQRIAISTPIAGMSVYDTDLGRTIAHDGTNWGHNPIDIIDDFSSTGTISGYIGENGWSGVGTYTIKGNEAGHIGIGNIATTGTAHFWLNYASGNAITEFDNSQMTFIVRLPSIVSCTLFVGVAFVNATSNGRKGMHFDPSLSPNWRILHDHPTNPDVYADTGIAATTGWAIITLKFNSGSSTVGTVQTLAGIGSATNSGETTGGSAGHCPQITLTSSSGTKSVDFDYFRLTQTTTRL